MKYIFLIITLLSTTLLFSCQSYNGDLSQTKNTNLLYLGQQFISPPSFHLETEQEIFMLDEEMIALVESKLMTTQSTKKKARLLLEHIFSQGNIALS